MNKTVTINIAGFVYHIDEEAYYRLDSYLKAVRTSIQQDGEEEIISDIEARIGELFSERIDAQSGVIRMNHVDEIMNIMGKPEDYVIDDEIPYQQPNYSSIKQPKKIYRDGEKRILGGVCSGLGHYLNVDPVWIRIIFILLLFLYGTSVLIYLILWIIIPKARTTSEILEMRGEPVNISNIEKRFKDGIPLNYNNNAATAATVFRKVIGISLIVFASLSIFGSFFAPIAFNAQKEFVFNNIITFNESQIGIPFWALNLSLFLMSAIPFIVLFILGIKILKPKTKHIGLVSAALGFIWLVAVFVFCYVMINADIEQDKIRDLFEESYESKYSKVDLDLKQNDTLFLIFNKDERIYTINDTISSDKKISEIEGVHVDILESNTGKSYIEIEEKIFNNKRLNFKSLGKYELKVEPNKNSTTLRYNYSIKSDTLALSNKILATYNDFTEDNSVNIKVYLTADKKIKLNGNDNRYFWNLNADEGKNVYKFDDKGTLINTNNNTIN
ncbi:PspC domain-containing protein [Flavobacterium sp. xlx-214]|uniref:PspC domain-containing protein n=1 Tax=unclassified Flavobacterium TaxID=196869 RepID=UPI0013D61F61|nr:MULTISPECIES: PspC domain-containing protein [unclassified Flavobacterium]MBA5793759.1 PspC domain-containing protein [Flavobacterium sp. xlx-221]QMI83220.1 PspC domain-containing protein [Flavobacterium sp. xlx-214]